MIYVILRNTRDSKIYIHLKAYKPFESPMLRSSFFWVKDFSKEAKKKDHSIGLGPKIFNFYPQVQDARNNNFSEIKGFPNPETGGLCTLITLLVHVHLKSKLS
jgi:hypothetical protein